jgi:hypothetical protein
MDTLKLLALTTRTLERVALAWVLFFLFPHSANRIVDYTDSGASGFTQERQPRTASVYESCCKVRLRLPTVFRHGPRSRHEYSSESYRLGQ